MYDDEIRSFVESVEPDFDYHGTEGAMAMVVESAQNMINLEQAIEYGELTVQQENVITDAFKAIWKRIKQFFNWILELIKKVLAKVKSFFMMLRRKLTMAAAKAFKTIGEFIKNHTNMDKTEDEEIEYKGLNKANVAKLLQNIPTISKTVKLDVAIVSKMMDNIPKDSIDDQNKTNIRAALKDNSQDSDGLKEIVDIINQNLNPETVKQSVYDAIYPGLNGKNFISELKEQLIEKKTIVASEKAFKEIFSNDILKNLDKAYDSIMKCHSFDIKNMNDIQKVVEKKAQELLDIKDHFTNIKKGLNKCLSMIFKSTSGVMTIIHSATATVAQAIASTFMSVYKSAFGATLKGLKRRAAYAVKSHKESYEFTIV